MAHYAYNEQKPPFRMTTREQWIKYLRIEIKMMGTEINQCPSWLFMRNDYSSLRKLLFMTRARIPTNPRAKTAMPA